MNILNFLVVFLIVALIFSIAWWALQRLGLPAPFTTWIAVGAAILVIILLVAFLGGGLAVPVLIR